MKRSRFLIIVVMTLAVDINSAIGLVLCHGRVSALDSALFLVGAVVSSFCLGIATMCRYDTDYLEKEMRLLSTMMGERADDTDGVAGRQVAQSPHTCYHENNNLPKGDNHARRIFRRKAIRGTQDRPQHVHS